MNERIPQFELHIRPMMRLLDRVKMSAVAGFDLWSYEDVKDAAGDILERLREDMPPTRFGGLWPLGWIDVFELWTKTGYSRLQLGATEDGYQVQRRDDRITITGSGELPDERYEFWLDLESATSDRRDYVLYFQPPPEPAGNTTPFRVRERFEAPTTLEKIAIRDAVDTFEFEL